MKPTNPTQTFLVEAADLLDQIEEIVLGLESHPDDAEAVNGLFRAFHTIKGSGAMFGFHALADFTHHLENTLDRVRNGVVPLSCKLLELIMAARDYIKILLETPQGRPADDPESRRIIAGLEALGGAAAQESIPTGKAQTPQSDARPPAADGSSVRWRIRFRPPHDMAATGLDPVSLLNELRNLGPCEVVAFADAVPVLDQLQPDQCYLSWEIILTTDRGLNAIKDVFIFVEDGSELIIEPTSTGPVSTRPIPGPVAQATEPVSAPKENVATIPVPVDAAPAQRKSAETSVRVPSDRLDQLVNLVGELVMNQSRLLQVASRINDSELAVPVEAIDRLIGELRDSVLEIRMMPIGATFSRFKRLVHDLSQNLGKEIDLVTAGAETELDKTVLDQLGEPLVHIIRNSIDHGIELPAERERIGKPRRAVIRLAASHAGSHVVVTIQDDGRGIDLEAVRAKAIEKKLIAHDSNLSEKDIINLIFLPGFSTAKQVTSVSGRGVGMDVVRRQIDALRGSIQISSRSGQGTTIDLRLPLTLAIIEGQLVGIGSDRFIIPMSAVAENVELLSEERVRNNGRNVIAVRGELVPYVRLRELFEIRGTSPKIEKVVIVSHEGHRVGLVVDSVLGSHQTVIQSLGRFYHQIEVTSGATIMGDGRVALILDLAGIVRVAGRCAQQPPPVFA